jgi:hypothetical protein
MKLTDAERYKRFLDAAKLAGASDSHEDFEAAFMKVASRRGRKERPKPHHQIPSRQGNDEEDPQR